MATATETATDSVGQSGSWDDLPVAEAELPPDAPPVTPDAPPADLTDVPKGHCHACGEFIVRPPGARGRAPKYHEECRPAKGSASRSVPTGPRGSSRAEKEAAQAVAAFRSAVVKGAVLLMAVDQYDAFCIMASLPGICDNLEVVLANYEPARKMFLGMKNGGGVAGLALSIIMLALPIAAHHKLLPQRASMILIQMPFTLVKLQQQMENGESALTDMMGNMLDRLAEAQTKAKRRAEANGAG